MSPAKQEARAVKVAIEDVIVAMPRPDQAAIRAIAQRIRTAVAEGDAQEDGIGAIALALVGAEVQEQQA